MVVVSLESVGGPYDWEQVEVGPRRVLPALPEGDEELGAIRWERWARGEVLTHIDPSCEVCGYEGPLAYARGMTRHQDPPRRTLLRRSRIASGQRPVWGPAVVPEPRWVYTHWASRCQVCDEMVVWRMEGGVGSPSSWVEIAYNAPAVRRPSGRRGQRAPQDEVLF